jgi:hypothetical protein
LMSIPYPNPGILCLYPIPIGREQTHVSGIRPHLNRTGRAPGRPKKFKIRRFKHSLPHTATYVDSAIPQAHTEDLKS